MQLLVSSIDGRLLSFSFPTTHVTLASVKQAFEDREGVPVSELRVSCNGRYLPDEFGFTEEQALGLPPLRVGLRVVGGKGGFGSLLRGGNTKVGQKKVPTPPPKHPSRLLLTRTAIIDDQLRCVPRSERTPIAPRQQREAIG